MPRSLKHNHFTICRAPFVPVAARLLLILELLSLLVLLLRLPLSTLGGTPVVGGEYVIGEDKTYTFTIRI